MRASAPTGMPKAIAPVVGADALVRPVVQATTSARVARSSCAAVGGSAAYGCGVPLAGKAERAERGACQMRPCTPLTSAPAPRESTVKSPPHSAAPVGMPSQTCRHHLTSTPVQKLCTNVQSFDQSVFSLWTVQSRSRWRLCRLRMRHTPCGYGPFLFWQDQIWGPRRAPRGGERRSKGAGAVFAAGGNGA